jgi:hypothetical protein
MKKSELFKVGAIAFGLLTMVASCANPAAEKIPELQKMVGETLTNSSSTVCLDNYAPSGANGPTYKDKLMWEVANAHEQLTSDRLDIRTKAKHALTWQFIAPSGDETVYKNFIKRTVKANPKDYDADIKTGQYLEVLDAVTRFGEGDFSKPERPSEALCEAVFRTIKLFDNMSGNEWKSDVIAFHAIQNQMPSVVDTKKGSFRTVQGGDSITTSMTKFEVNLAKH